MCWGGRRPLAVATAEDLDRFYYRRTKDNSPLANHLHAFRQAHASRQRVIDGEAAKLTVSSIVPYGPCVDVLRGGANLILAVCPIVVLFACLNAGTCIASGSNLLNAVTQLMEQILQEYRIARSSFRRCLIKLPNRWQGFIPIGTYLVSSGLVISSKQQYGLLARPADRSVLRSCRGLAPRVEL